MEKVEDDKENDQPNPAFHPLRLISAALNIEDYDRAAALIDQAEKTLPATDMHRVVAYKAMLRRRTGHSQDSIDLMRQARDLSPTWLPHLCLLAEYLLNAGQWGEAETVFDELIRLSEETNEHYFLEDARFGKMICLKQLGRNAEIAAVKAKIAPGAKSIRPSGIYHLDDFG
jgi:tetratricopeptide (TPR) repeat protein